jgi:glutamate decarboxylase
MAVLRFVVRAGFNRDMADELLHDIGRAVQWFQSLDGPMPSPLDRQPAFHH